MDYREVENKMREIINANDPIGLVETGAAPDDEYSLEVKMIIDFYKATTSQAELVSKIKFIFDEMFGGEYQNIEQIEKIAIEIIKIWPGGINF